MSWPQILAIVVATGVPCWIWGYLRGHRAAIRELYGPRVLQDSAVDLAVEDSPDGGS